MKKNKNSLSMKMFFLTLLGLTCGFSLLHCSGVSRTDDWPPRPVSPPPHCKSSPVTCTPPPPCPPCPPPSPTARPASPQSREGARVHNVSSDISTELGNPPNWTREQSAWLLLLPPPPPLPLVLPQGLAPPCSTAGAWTPPFLGLAPPCSTAGAWTPPSLGLAPPCITAGAWTPPTLGLAPPCSTAGAWTPPYWMKELVPPATAGRSRSSGQHPKMA